MKIRTHRIIHIAKPEIEEIINLLPNDILQGRCEYIIKKRVTLIPAAIAKYTGNEGLKLFKAFILYTFLDVVILMVYKKLKYFYARLLNNRCQIIPATSRTVFNLIAMLWPLGSGFRVTGSCLYLTPHRVRFTNVSTWYI